LRTTGSERRSLFTTVVDHIDGETTVVLGLQHLWWSDAKSDAVLKILHTFCIRNPDYLPKGASGEDINATTESSMPTSIVFHIAVVTAIFFTFFPITCQIGIRRQIFYRNLLQTTTVFADYLVRKLK